MTSHTHVHVELPHVIPRPNAVFLPPCSLSQPPPSAHLPLSSTISASELIRRVQVVCQACEQVMNSERLAAVMQKVLAIGNAMNRGTYKGSAAGFTIDSLLKLTSTRGADGKTTLLDFVVKVITQKSDNDTLLSFYEDLNDVREAVRYVTLNIYIIFSVAKYLH